MSLTGLSAYAIYQKNLSDGSRYLISDSLIYYEEEIFNDIYSYDGIEAGLGFKHYFNEDIELSLEAKYLIRNYSSLPAADKNGTELDYLREDKQFGFGAGLSFDLSNVINGLSLSTAWNYYKNNSNDYYYKYSNQMISCFTGL
ncbi:MAG: surface lipoprotein assembly modifier [Ignavibacteriales bacterium]|nr:surface lipoprotein assembly modifier [Ignavibacteriales bacterium]